MCGVFGIINHPEAAAITYLGLHALQHRGQEGSGIVSAFSGQDRFSIEKGLGLVSEVFTGEALRRLPGDRAIGHNRYSTAGGNLLKNVQPLLISYALGNLALAHNGNLVNAQALRQELEQQGAIFQSTTDTEVIVHLIALARGQTLVDRLIRVLGMVQGAYSLVLLSDDGLYGIRDPYGFRPLSLGRLKEAWVIASETIAFDLIEATYVRDIDPGEIVWIDPSGRLHSHRPFPKLRRAACIFEHIYFSRPDSQVFGANVYAMRRLLGRQLAAEAPVQADLVIPVPDSGMAIALGYAEESGLPFEQGLVRSHYIGRTFIEPQQSIRDFGVKLKLNAIREVLAGRRVVVVDDSIVRGTTSRKIIRMIRQAGVREVHVRIGSPPIVSPCYYGIDTPTREELIASAHNVEEIRDYITADSLRFLSVEGMLKVFDGGEAGFCTACFTENYPVPIAPQGLIQPELF